MAPPSSSGVPPSLPPSVEEAYKRKCIQLRQRTNEVEEANDVHRLRLARMSRTIEKQRLERAFLLEQLAKRTSTNVEDSEGSPSPPPTPKEKPLRIKRGHRKPSFLNNIDGRAESTFIPSGPGGAISPSSDAFPANILDPNTQLPMPIANNTKRPLPSATPTNGHSTGSPPSSRRPKSAFDLYCNDMRSVIMAQNRKEISEGTFDIDRALATGWQGLEDENRAIFQKRFEDMRKESEGDIPGAALSQGHRSTMFDQQLEEERVPGAEREREGDEDIEMADEQDVEVEKRDESGSGNGGFTAINLNRP